MIARAIALRPMLRARQADCEALGRVPDDVNAELIRAGFYRTVQPRCFGGYEFDVPTFHRVMAEIARGCSETGWVLALTAGHPMILANFPLQGQRELYGASGEFRCPAAFNPPGTAAPAPGGYRVTASWPSASGCDMGTHHLGSAIVTDADGKPTAKVIQLILERSQYRIVDDWHVMGMQGTGSKRVVVEDAFVPAHRAIRRSRRDVARSRRSVRACIRTRCISAASRRFSSARPRRSRSAPRAARSISTRRRCA